MVVTVVLRLLPGPLESGELVGQVEHVESGLVEPVRSAEELVGFVRRSQAAAGSLASARAPSAAAPAEPSTPAE